MSEISENDLSLVLLDTDSRHVCAGLLIAGGWPQETKGATVHISPRTDLGMVYILGSMGGHQGSGVVHGEFSLLSQASTWSQMFYCNRMVGI